eukprot:scaffold111799_cov23-Tisochrysis_lutea.AAC.1
MVPRARLQSARPHRPPAALTPRGRRAGGERGTEPLHRVPRETSALQPRGERGAFRARGGVCPAQVRAPLPRLPRRTLHGERESPEKRERERESLREGEKQR